MDVIDPRDRSDVPDEWFDPAPDGIKSLLTYIIQIQEDMDVAVEGKTNPHRVYVLSTNAGHKRIRDAAKRFGLVVKHPEPEEIPLSFRTENERYNVKRYEM